MSEKKLTGVTNGEYTLEEIKVGEQFYFFRNDHEALGNVGILPIEMYARYLIQKMREGEIDDRYTREINYELSDDRKVLRLTISEHTKRELYIVKSNESEAPEVTEPNFFKRVFAKWFD